MLKAQGKSHGRLPREEQPRNRSQPARHWIGREPQALKGVGSEKRLSRRFTKDDKGELRASVDPDPSAPDIPLHPAAIRQDKGIPGVRDHPQAVEERRRQGRVRGARVHRMKLPGTLLRKKQRTNEGRIYAPLDAVLPQVARALALVEKMGALSASDPEPAIQYRLF